MREFGYDYFRRNVQKKMICKYAYGHFAYY